MGTRCLTFVYEENENKPFLCMYRQNDGYREGHGKELAAFLAPMGVVNGYGHGEVAGTSANGMGCLAAQLVAHFKTPHGIGGFYLQAPDLGADSGQEYEYHIFPDSRIKVIENGDPDTVVFNGSWSHFVLWANDVAYDVKEDVVDSVSKATRVSLRDALKAGDTVSVRFKKADGNERLMKCTLNGALIPTASHPTPNTTSTGHVQRHDPKLYKVFDLDKQDWRSFREERIIDWCVV
jgi:hypothetical protein